MNAIPDNGSPLGARLPGLVQWFRMGEDGLLGRTIAILNELRIRELRLLFSWADWESDDGPAWIDHVVRELAAKAPGARLMPDLFYTPPDKAMANEAGERKTSHPPQNLSDYAAFVEEILKRYGGHFDWVQVWNEPEWKPYWESDLDPDASLFSEMALQAVDVIHAYGKKAALGGLSSYLPQWITLVHKHGLLPNLDAIGFHYSPSWTDQRHQWFGWETELDTVRTHLDGLGSTAEIWIAETGFATMGDTDEATLASESEQIRFFDGARQAPADKVFWFSAIDQSPDHKTDNVINMAGVAEDAAYHFGLETFDGRRKPLFEHWKRLAETPDSLRTSYT